MMFCVSHGKRRIHGPTDSEQKNKKTNRQSAVLVQVRSLITDLYFCAIWRNEEKLRQKLHTSVCARPEQVNISRNGSRLNYNR